MGTPRYRSFLDDMLRLIAGAVILVIALEIYVVKESASLVWWGDFIVWVIVYFAMMFAFRLLDPRERR